MRFRLRCVVLLLAAFAAHAVTARGGQNSLADAQREFNGGRYHQAVDMLTDAVVKSPQDGPLHFLLGQSYYELQDYTRAVTSFERSVQLAPNQSEYHDWLGIRRFAAAFGAGVDASRLGHQGASETGTRGVTAHKSS